MTGYDEHLIHEAGLEAAPECKVCKGEGVIDGAICVACEGTGVELPEEDDENMGNDMQDSSGAMIPMNLD